MFDDWSAGGEPVSFYDLRKAGALGAIQDFYAVAGDEVLSDTLAKAYEAGAQTAVVENRYIDADYRNEHASFFSTTFRRYPSVAHRMHFFKEVVPEFGGSAPIPFVFEQYSYLGYIVLRPVKSAPVGRTMLAYPELKGTRAILCLAKDRVSLLGSDLEVTGMPFYSQDYQLNRCGQAAMMSTSYYWYKVFGESRLLPGEIASSVASASEMGRLVPSPGVTVHQLADTATAMGLPPIVYPTAKTVGQDPRAVICRYLNSRYPVTVFTRTHAFVLVGYRRELHADGSHSLQFCRHDDVRGPYQWVEFQLDEIYGSWAYLIVPLPPKVYLSGEAAEIIGEAKLKDQLGNSSNSRDKALYEALEVDESHLSFRSAVVSSNSFKRTAVDRGLPPEIAAAYQFMPMSRYVWIVELTNRDLRDADKPCVLAEVVIDATDHMRDSKPLAWRIPGGLAQQVLDRDEVLFNDQLSHHEPVNSVVTHITPHTAPR